MPAAEELQSPLRLEGTEATEGLSLTRNLVHIYICIMYGRYIYNYLYASYCTYILKVPNLS